MPYAVNEDLPPSVRRHLPEHAQDVYREAFNHAFAAHAGDSRREEASTASPGPRSSAPTSRSTTCGHRARPANEEENAIMSAVGLEGIDHAVQQAHIWINDVEKRLDWNNKPRAYRLLKTVLHALRDHLQVEAAAHLGAQLPTLIRGVYYEQWRPAATPVRDRHLESFLAAIDQTFSSDPLDDTAEAVATVLNLLSDRISAGEVAKVRQSLPAQLRLVWPARQKETVRA
jgi:uncharacterized protein (DUF2267 family)